MRKSLLVLLCCTGLTTLLSIPPVQAQAPIPLPAVFVIMMENHNWSQIKNSAAAPYINLLLSQGAHAEAYYNPPGLHPSEPNYIWLEAGPNLGITNNNPPSANHKATTAHLTTLLNTAGITWRAYQEGITGTDCPLVNNGLYAVRHNPMVFFDDVTGGNKPQWANCIAHERPYTELASDLISGNLAQYNFITPNVCNDMHDSSGCATTNSVLNGDNWLKQAIPPIRASNAYQNGGIIFITWDEGAGSDGPIGMIVLSPHAKIGYSNTIRYTHSSTVRTLQEIFGVQPFLATAATATDLSDLFNTFPSAIPPANDNFANSQTISTLPYTNSQSNGAASLEFGEQPATCEGAANIKNTVWYKYTATATQKTTFSVTDSSVVKGISVWTGSLLGNLAQVGCGIPGTNAAAAVDTTSGTVYYIRMGSSNGASSNFTVQAGLPPANDNFVNAIPINTGFAPFTNTQNVIGASLETGDPPATCGAPAFRTVWYKYISLANNVLSLNTTASGYDTVLSVWTGAGLGALTQVGCNDNDGSSPTSALTMNTTPGLTYFIRVSSKGGTLTNLTFNVSIASLAAAPPLQNYFTTATPTLSWNRLTGVTQYTIQVSKSSLFTPLAYPAVTVPASQLSVTTAPLPEGVYYWRVSANGGGTWSTADTFVIDLP